MNDKEHIDKSDLLQIQHGLVLPAEVSDQGLKIFSISKENCDLAKKCIGAWLEVKAEYQLLQEGRINEVGEGWILLNPAIVEGADVEE